MTRRPLAAIRHPWLGFLLVLLIALSPAVPLRAQDEPAEAEPADETATIAPPITADELEPLPEGATSEAPRNLEDLRAIQQRVRDVVDLAGNVTVGVLAGGGTGSGVIVSPDGYVLTAAHVSTRPGRRVMVVLPNGKRVAGQTLGTNFDVDGGLIKITGDPQEPFAKDGQWLFASMADIATVQPGHWCVATGHPGGFQPGRPPVVRVGRVLGMAAGYMVTDCTLVGGDSGGPLFDLRGNVIGIHSRISMPTSVNVHVPVNTFAEAWARLVGGEAWGGRPFMGIVAEDHDDGAKITEVRPRSAAARAQLKVGDVITTFDGEAFDGFKRLVRLVGKKEPGDEVVVELMREDRPMSVKLKLGRLP